MLLLINEQLGGFLFAECLCLLCTHAHLLKEQNIPAMAAGLLSRPIIACSDLTLLKNTSFVHCLVVSALAVLCGSSPATYPSATFEIQHPSATLRVL